MKIKVFYGLLLLMMCLTSQGCISSAHSQYKDSGLPWVTVNDDLLKKEYIYQQLRELLVSEWASIETEDRSNFKMTTKWRNERDKSTFYFALFAYALTSSGTPGSYRAIAKLSEERPYLITLDVESK